MLRPILQGLLPGLPLRGPGGRPAESRLSASRLRPGVAPVASGSACVVEAKKSPCWWLPRDEDGNWKRLSRGCFAVSQLLYLTVLYFTLAAHSWITLAIIIWSHSNYVSRQLQQRQFWQPLWHWYIAAQLSPLSLIIFFFLEIQMRYISVDHLGAVCHIEWWLFLFFFFFTFGQLKRAISWIYFFPFLLSWFSRQPPVSESHWRMLLQDMLTMQQNIYTCLESDDCYEVVYAHKLFPCNWEILAVTWAHWTHRWWLWASLKLIVCSYCMMPGNWVLRYSLSTFISNFLSSLCSLQHHLFSGLIPSWETSNHTWLLSIVLLVVTKT